METIDLSGIADVPLRNQIANAFEVVAKQIVTLTKALEVANAEIARLKGQPRKPQFPDQPTTGSISVTGLLDTNKKLWKKQKKEIAIDKHKEIPAPDACVCGSTQFRSLRTKKKIVQGIIIKRETIAYTGRDLQCLNCLTIVHAALPKESFDAAIQTLVSQLKFDGRFSHGLIHRFLIGFQIQISYGEITQILKRNSKKLLPALQQLKMIGVRNSSVVQSDATGAKRRLKTGKGVTQYLNFLGNRFLSIFKITKKYNACEMNALLGKEGRKKILVSDDGSPNNACTCKGLQLCWVHEIRLYKKLFPFFTPHQALQQQILSQWRTFYHLAKIYGSDPPTTALPDNRKQIETMFTEITTQITGYADLDKQLRLSLKKREKLLYFLDHPGIPIQNNESEVSLRAGVIMRAISGPTKSLAGDRSIERHLSIIQTIRKQGLPVFDTLYGLLTGQLAPSILTMKSA